MKCSIESRIQALFAGGAPGETQLMAGGRGNGPLGAAPIQSGLGSIPAFDGYAVLGTVGGGAFSVVLRARDEKLQRQVAIKVLTPLPLIDDESKGRFLHEARALARVHHPNVLTVHAVIEQAGTIAIVTEYIDGKTIEAIVRERGLYSATEAAQLGTEVCKALAAVHAAGIVHRDVKPANILRAHGGRIVLADFGLGAFLSGRKRPLDGRVLAGTPLFMSPEQAKAGSPDPRSDLYALGVVLYSITTGQFPTEAPTMGELLENIREGTLRPLRDVRPDLPDAFVATVTKALAADPDDRFQSAGEMEQALLSVQRRRGFELALGLGRWQFRLGVTIGMLVLCVVLGWLAVASRRGEVTEVAANRPPARPSNVVATSDRPEPVASAATQPAAERDLFVYVLADDATGKPALLSAGRGGGSTPIECWNLPAQSKGTQVLTIACREPVGELEALAEWRLFDLSQSAGMAYPRLQRVELQAVLERVGGLSPAEADELLASKEALRDIIARLSPATSEEAEERGVYVNAATVAE